MNQWSEKAQGHQVWQTLADLETSLGNADKREGIDERGIAALDRVRAAVRYVRLRLEGVDPLILPVNVLEALVANLTRVRDEITHFSGNGDLGHLGNANTNVDSTLQAASALPVVVSSNEVRQLSRAAGDYRRGLENVLQEVKARESALAASAIETQQKLSALQVAIDAAKANADSFLSEARNGFQQSQELRQSEGARISSEQEAKFLALTSDLSNKVTTALTEMSAQRQETEKKVEAELAAIRNDHAAKAAAVLVEIESQKARADELLAIIGERGVTSGYWSAAEKAKTLKFVWQFLTVGAFVVLILFAKLVFFTNADAETTWPMLVGRSLLTVAIGFAAAYSARQGDKAAQVESFNRSMALELAALGPFLAPLDPAEREKFRVMVGSKTFGRIHGLEASDGTGSPTSIADLAGDKRFVESIATLAKAFRGS